MRGTATDCWFDLRPHAMPTAVHMSALPPLDSRGAVPSQVSLSAPVAAHVCTAGPMAESLVCRPRPVAHTTMKHASVNIKNVRHNVTGCQEIALTHQKCPRSGARASREKCSRNLGPASGAAVCLGDPPTGRLKVAKAAGVGIIARVPLASGLPSGKYSKDTTFAESDHRNYNRTGAAFDVGETFSGVDFDLGLTAVKEFEERVPDGVTTAQAAIAWILAQDGVSTVIPGARTVEQAVANASAASTGTLGTDLDAGVREIYGRYFREAIHPRW